MPQEHIGPNVQNYTQGYNEKTFWNLEDYTKAQFADMGVKPDDNGFYPINELHLLQYADDVKEHNDNLSHYIETATRIDEVLFNDHNSQAIKAMVGLFNGDFNSIKIDENDGQPGQVNEVARRIHDWSNNLWTDSLSDKYGYFQINFRDDEIYDRLINLYGSRLNKLGVIRVGKEALSAPSVYHAGLRVDNQDKIPLLMMYLNMATSYKDVNGATPDWNFWNNTRELFGSYQRWDIEGLNGENSSRKKDELYNQRSSRENDVSGYDFDEINEFGREMTDYYKIYTSYGDIKEEEHYVPLEYYMDMKPIRRGDRPVHTVMELLRPDEKESQLKNILKDDVNNKLNVDFKNMPQGSILFEGEDGVWSKYVVNPETKEKELPDDELLDLLSDRTTAIMKSSDPWFQLQMYIDQDRTKGNVFCTAITLKDEATITQSNTSQANSTKSSARLKLAKLKRIIVPNLFREDENEELQTKYNTDSDKAIARGENIRASRGKYNITYDANGTPMYIKNIIGDDGMEHLFLLVGNNTYDLDKIDRQIGSELAGTLVSLVNSYKKWEQVAQVYNHMTGNQDKFSEYLKKAENDDDRIKQIINSLK